MNKQRRHYLFLGLAALILLTSCGGTPRAGECTESAGKTCLTQKVCTYDKTKKCDMCYCDSADLQYKLDENNDRDREMPPPR